MRATLAWLAGAAVLVHGAAAAAGPFDLRAPERVLLGRDRSVEITLAAGGDLPQLAASAGTLSTPRPGEDGRVHVTYTPPELVAPQLAIVVAVSADRSVVDWIAVPLVAPAHIELNGEPRVRVRVVIGELEYGPVLTDGDGRASVVVDVGPGIAEAETIATDQHGNEKRGALPLFPPPVRRLFGVCPTGSGRSLWFAVTPRGAPADAEELSLSANLGAVDAAVAVGPGVWEARFTAPAAAAEPQAAALRGTLASDGASADCAVAIAARLVEVRRPPPPPPPPRPPPAPRRVAVSASIGYLTNFGKVSAPIAMAAASYRLPVLSHRLAVTVEAGAYASDDERAAAGVAEMVRTRVTAAPLLGGLAYALPVDPVRITAGVGAGVLLSERELSSPSAGRRVDSGPRPALSVAVGGDLALGAGRVLVEAGYLYAPVDDARLDGNAGGLHLAAGYRWEP